MKAKALLMLLFLPAAAWPQFGDIPKDVPHIVVEGMATVEAPADLVTVRAQVFLTDKDAAKAKETVEQRVAGVLALARDLGLAKADICASQLGVEPAYTWHKDERIYEGTKVKREIVLTLRDLTKYARLIRGLAAVPVTTIEPPQLGTSGIEGVKKEALKRAVTDAQQAAKLVTAPLGVAVGEVYQVLDRNFSYVDWVPEYPSWESPDDKGESFAPGTIAVSATIHLAYRLARKD